MHAHTQAHMHTCMHASTHASTHAHMHACKYAHMHARMHTHTSAHTCTHVQVEVLKTCQAYVLRWIQTHRDTESVYTHAYVRICTTQRHTRAHCSEDTAQSWASSPRHLSVGLGVVPSLGVVWGSPGMGFCEAWNFHAEAIMVSCRGNGKTKGNIITRHCSTMDKLQKQQAQLVLYGRSYQYTCTYTCIYHCQKLAMWPP